MMSSGEPSAHLVEFNGAIVRKGFWLYVLEATPPAEDGLLYVGRTGDSSSFNAQSVYKRLGQHLGEAQTTNQMRRYLSAKNLTPEECRFRLVAYGPIYPESSTKDEAGHYPVRDKVAALEKELAALLEGAGYQVLNRVLSKKPLDEQAFQPVVEAFAVHFPKLAASHQT